MILTIKHYIKKNIDTFFNFFIIKNSYGAVAQMGERMTGSHEVRGSSPLSSTKFSNKIRRLVIGASFVSIQENHTHMTILAFIRDSL